MILTTTEMPPGYVITKILAPVRGNIAQGTGSIAAVAAAIAQTESEEYTSLLEGARREAEKRMIEHAKRLEADGIVGVRYETSVIGAAHAVESLAYGTAVKMRPE